MNGPQLDAAILFSKATTQQSDLENDVSHKYVYTLVLITTSLNTVGILLFYYNISIIFWKLIKGDLDL